jgi:GT2 family glycosyltransferase
MKEDSVDGRVARVLVVVPVYGHVDVTHALMRDLRREGSLADVVVVDNLGDYEALFDEEVLKPGRNLGWAGGTNFGTEECRRADHAGFVWLNNDTRLAEGFIAGLLRSEADTGGGVIGPFYDCHWLHQRLADRPAVESYHPRRRHYRAPFLDGTCMYIPATTVDRIGLLDAETFAPLGWGAEIDYCLQARAAGIRIVVTEAAYLHHERSVTAQTMFGGGYEEYFGKAYPVALEGLRRKWGPDWQRDLGVDPDTSQTVPLGRRDRIIRRPVLR